MKTSFKNGRCCFIEYSDSYSGVCEEVDFDKYKNAGEYANAINNQARERGETTLPIFTASCKSSYLALSLICSISLLLIF